MDSTTTPTTTDENANEVEPSARYDAIYGTNYQLDSEAGTPEREAELEQERILQDTQAERRVAAEVMGDDPADEYDGQDTRADPLTWDDFSVTEDPELLAEICSLFTGVSAGEEVEEIRRKLRTAEPEWYANAFLVARGFLDPNRPGPMWEGN